MRRCPKRQITQDENDTDPAEARAAIGYPDGTARALAAHAFAAHMHARRVVAQVLARKACIPARLAELRRNCGVDPR